MKHQSHFAFSNANDNLSGFSDDHLIQAIISKVAPDGECQKITKSLLSQFGDIRSLLSAPCSEIMRRTKASKPVAEELKRTHELLRAIAHAKITRRPLLDDFESVLDFCQILLAGERREQFHTLLLDKSFHLIAHECLQIGTVDHVAVYPRELMARVLHSAACKIILIHNHPSGNALPSKADREMTRLLQEVGKFFGISIVDHIIVGAMGSFSFREQGLIAQPAKTANFRDDVSSAFSENHQS